MCTGNRGCPAVFESNEGYVIIGRDVTNDIANLKDFNGSIDFSEKAVLIPFDILKGVEL